MFHCVVLWLLLIVLQCVADTRLQYLRVALIHTEDSIELLL